MRVALPSYPVDRYLAESSEQKQFNGIPCEDLWQIEPMTMRPEDVTMHRKLQELLITTSEELKTLTSDLKSINQQSIAIKTERAPLDEAFNEKIHIEELVTSKFNNTCFINKTKRTSDTYNNISQNIKVTEPLQASTIKPTNKPLTDTKKLSKSEIKIVTISENDKKTKSIKDKSNNIHEIKRSNEYYFKYQPKFASQHGNQLSVHKMPQIDIRSECKIQEIFHFEILPNKDNVDQYRANTVTVEMRHKNQNQYTGSDAKAIHTEHYVQPKIKHKPTNRKVTKIAAFDSSESTNSSAETHNLFKLRSVTCRKPCDATNPSQSPIGMKSKKHYIKTATSKHKEKQDSKIKINKINNDNEKNYLNNAEYLPYSHLTLGGITLTDLEKVMSNIPAHNMPLSPILDQILGSQDKNITQETKAISISEENLVRDVEYLKKNLTGTLMNPHEKTDDKIDTLDKAVIQAEQVDYSNEEPEYDDDFEDVDIEESKTESESTTIQPIMKSHKLSLRETIETHEFIPEVKSQDNETQCSSVNFKALKITQTSPRRITQPINNVLWPLSTDPNSEINKAFELEKEIIKKLILEEYGDVLNKGTTTASTSANINNDMNKNSTALQKNTQTSTAHVKSVMTSPIRLKTRTTSPVTLNVTVDHETSPHIFAVNQTPKEIKSDIELSHSADVDLSIILSSPKLSLQLPKTSHDVINNLNLTTGHNEKRKFCNEFKYSVKRNNTLSDTSTTSADVSSSEISSLGEVKYVPFYHSFGKYLSPAMDKSSDSGATSPSSLEHLVKGKLLKSDGEVTRLSTVGDGIVRPGDESRSEGQLRG